LYGNIDEKSEACFSVEDTYVYIGLKYIWKSCYSLRSCWSLFRRHPRQGCLSV